MAKPVRFRDKWRIRWFDARNKRQSEIYDTHDDALFALRRHEVETQEIRRGLRPLQLPDKRFDDLCDYWLENRAPYKRSRQDDESIIRRHLRPFFGHVKLRELGSVHVHAFVRERKHLNEKTVNNHLTLLISMLNAAKDDAHWLAVVPKIRKHRIPLFTTDYRYLRTKEEIHRFLDAARERGEMVFVLYATALYTGMRQGELAGLHWADIDFSRRLITVQRSFAGPTKAKDVRYVPILDPLLPILRDWRLRDAHQLVFPNQRGKMHQESARIFQENFHRILDSAGFPRQERHGKLRRYIVFHDTRHTFASHWMMSGGDIFKLQKILGHKSMQMTQRYAHLAPEAFASDHDRLGGMDELKPASVTHLSSVASQ
ncbi:tyrosine-type recombinase/integrase [Myxococcota bacterium]